MYESVNILTEGCKRGDRHFQKKFYERYYGFSLKIVFRYINHFEIAKDVVNDGFLKIFSKIYSFHFTGSVKVDNEKLMLGWIKRIMVNTAIDELRKSRVEPISLDYPDQVWANEKTVYDADQALMYKELVIEIKKLPPTYRLIFNLFVIDGYGHHEIASMLGISVGTSKSSLWKARAHLQKKLKSSYTKIHAD
jgi:RNA polymerase sigma-70 factor (ECF subfamily)